MLIVFISLVPGVSWAGHLGGAVAGAAVAVPLVYSRFGQGAQRWLGWAGVAAVPLLCFGLVYNAVAADSRQQTGRPGQRVELNADDPDVQRARSEYRKAFQTADAIGTAGYEDWRDEAGKDFKGARTVLKGEFVPKDDKATQALAVRFRLTGESLKELAKKFQPEGQFQNKHIVRDVADARKLFEEWSKFYTTLAESISPAKNWTGERVEELNEQDQQIQRLHRELRKSAIFKAPGVD
jgi:hypothetical protein